MLNASAFLSPPSALSLRRGESARFRPRASEVWPPRSSGARSAPRGDFYTRVLCCTGRSAHSKRGSQYSRRSWWQAPVSAGAGVSGLHASADVGWDGYACASPRTPPSASGTAERPEFGLEKKKETVATLSRDSADKSFDTVLQELTAIQKDGPRNVAILGTRYASYLHQQIIELLTYANVLVGNHVFTSGAGGTNAAVIRGALRAEKPDLLTVVLPQSLRRQPPDTQEQLKKVGNLVQMQHNDDMPLDVASQLCNSDILSRCTHFIAFAFHDSDVVLESVRQAKELRMITTVMFLD